MSTRYYYDEQIKKRMTAFMSIFSIFHVKTGKREDGSEKFIKVPVRYGDADRVAAWVKSEATQNKMIRLPMISAVDTNLTLDDTLRKGISVERRSTYLPTGSVFPDDIQVVHQLQPIPYRLETEIAIYTSNKEQQLQLLEQILVLFDPTFQLQVNDKVLDWTKITTVKLENIGLENNYPIGTDRNIRIVKLSFSMPIYLSIPANVKQDFVKDIYVRLGVVENADLTNEEIVANLDQQGIDYDKWFSLDDVDIS